MAAPEVLIVATGTANLASIRAGLARAGARPRPAASPGEVISAARVVLPGVGAFGAAMGRLREQGYDEALTERLRHRRPLLAICLGLQLLAEGSRESPGIPGLGILPGEATRFGKGVRIPQLGWNRVRPDSAAPNPGLVEEGWAYFANSYRIKEAPPGWQASRAHHGESFIASLEQGAVLACQFHPELSGAWGTALIRRWLALPEQPKGDR